MSVRGKSPHPRLSGVGLVGGDPPSGTGTGTPNRSTFRGLRHLGPTRPGHRRDGGASYPHRTSLTLVQRPLVQGTQE